MPENCRETVDTAKLIKGILDSYPENAILRELLQNSDDAGATSQIFILDTRTHGVQSLIDQALKDTQGPSLLAVNDSVFREDDWKALRTLHGSNKTAEHMKTGKFGLGFRACYHITDNPHILSQRKLVIFDPHEELSAPFQGGVTLDLLDEGGQYPDQLAAFGAAVSDLVFPFEGTVVRLPLRTIPQAGRSRIKSTATLPNDISGYFGKFVENELSTTMLFLKHVKSIELREISPNGRMRVIGMASKIGVDSNDGDPHTHLFSRGLAARDKTFRFRIKTDRSDDRTWRIYDSVQDAAETSKLMSSRLKYDVGPDLTKDKLFSHVALAIPLDSRPFRGRLFTLLPLPIYPGFPLHIHGILALTPDRQSLRNKEDTGMNSYSREKLLVEWNHAIFDTFVPFAWAKLLATLVQEDELCTDIWSAWPHKMSDDHLNTSSYWGGISRKLLQAVLSADLQIFPTSSPTYDVPSYVSLKSSLVAAPSDLPVVLAALARTGVTLVQPPEHIYHLLEKSEFTPMAPVHVRRVLLSRLVEISSSSSADKDVILAYLVRTPPVNLSNVIGLPLIPLTNGERTMLCGADTTSVIHVLASAEEAELYEKCDKDMIALAAMLPAVQRVFCSPQAGQQANVISLGVDRVSKYLHSLFGHFDPGVDEIEVPDATAKVTWLGCFWTWMDTWEHAKGLIPRIQQLHLLPTTTGTLRTVSSRILISTDIEHNLKAIRALGKVGVQFLHPSISLSAISSMKCGVPPSDILFVLELISQDKLFQLDSQTITRVQKFFIQCLRGCSKPFQLSTRHRAKFIQLPIFPIRVPGPKSTASNTGPVRGEYIFVRSDCPLPIAPKDKTWTFVDVSTSTILALAIDPNAVANACDEVGILEKAIPYLECQPLDLLDTLVDRIICRVLELSPTSRDKLLHIPFVPVNGDTKRSAPKNIIDPGSEIAQLFDRRDAQLPAGRFRDGPFLSVMQSQRFFQRELTSRIVKDRLIYISATPGDPSTFKRAEILLKLLDKFWSPQFHNVISKCSSAWLPTTRGLRCADQCRDTNEDRHLFDLVLAVIDVKLTSPGLRKALGWRDGVLVDVLISQFRLTIEDSHLPRRGERLIKLVKSLATRFANGGISPDGFATLKGIVHCRSWIPVTPYELVATHHAVLSADAKLGGPFKNVPLSLAEGKFGEFLERMGCTKRPTLESLLDEVLRLANRSCIPQVLQILEEIAHYHRTQFTDDHRARLLIPDSQGDFRKVDEVYFNDMHIQSAHDFGFPTHTTISKSLASDLSLRFFSSLMLGEADEDEDGDEEDDDDDIREDLVKRINGVLNDYNIQYALNEFLANAADAGASHFSALLDERSFNNRTIISAQMAEFQAGPALILFNNGVFSSRDFSGMRQIGEGGKTEASDTIGRFGLGALSLYHFTEVPMIVSGGHVMLLDPSATYLPPRKGRKRTSLKRPLNAFMKKYPDQMSPFESLFGFSLSDSEYRGTLFRLPLRSNASPLSAKSLSGSDCLNLLKEPYYQLAQSALFFTNLTEITAGHYHAFENRLPLWSVSVVRQERSTFKETFHRQKISLALVSPNGASRAENWLITGSVTPLTSVPAEHDVVLERLKLTSSSIGLPVQMAFRLCDSSSPTSDSQHRLFSSLRLPQATSLPLHLHSQFCLAPDRRSIRFDPADSTGRRVPQSAYNVWILRNIVPPLYMFSLYHLADSTTKDNSAWWPADVNDDISREVVCAFYDHLPASSSPICRTVSRELILPNNAVFQATEPPAVVHVLSKLKVSNYVQLSRKLRRRVQETPLSTLDAGFLNNAIRNGSETFIKLFKTKKLELFDLNIIVRFILESNVSLVDLPLLPLADGSLGTFHGPGSLSIYHSEQDLGHIFPPTRFIHTDLEATTVARLLWDNTLNIKAFDSFALAALVQDRLPVTSRCTVTPNNAAWIQLFWESYSNLPSRFKLDSSVLSKLPLVPTCNQFEFVSSNYCEDESNSVLPYPWSFPCLKPIAIKLGIIVLQPSPSICCLPDYQFSFGHFLRCIKSGKSQLTDLLLREHEQLAAWICMQSRASLSKLSKDTLFRLPLWHARVNGSLQLLPAADIKMLPPGVSLNVLSAYFDPSVAIAEYSATLQAFVKDLSKSSKADGQLKQHVRYPDSLLPDQLDGFRALLNVMLSFTNIRPTNMRVPNGELTVVPVNQLYDHSIPLFAAALETSQTTSHIHQRFRDLEPRLRAVGLVHTVTFDDFLMCARRIHKSQDEQDDDSPADASIVHRAETVYQYYSSHLPSKIMSKSSRWAQLHGIRFIPRYMHRRRLAFESYPAETYCRPLPAIVSPGELVLEEFQSVAWTQRGLFVTEPPTDLVFLNPSLGIPRAEEVVAHLLVLALDIAPEYPENRALLRDLHSTYEWLNRHVDTARTPLLQHENDRIFLNVDETSANMNWRWCSSKELVFNLHYDEKGLIGVREYLIQFRPLLLAAGATNLSDPTFVFINGSQHGESGIRGVFNDMRKEGQLTDIVLMPTAMDTNVVMGRLRAHTSFLAATIPHLQTALLGEWTESRSTEFCFEGSFFGACAVLDFVYTGEIPIKDFEAGERAMDILRDLLELLDTAEGWGMQDLKAKIEWLIAEKFKLVSPETYAMILEHARSHNATSLVQFCQDFERDNLSVLRVLSN